MFKYNFKLAVRSLLDRPIMTFLMVLTIAIGLGLFMMVSTMRTQGGGVPLAHKAKNLYLIQLDNRELTAPEVSHHLRSVNVTYQDAKALLDRAPADIKHSITWTTNGILNIEDQNILPIRSIGAATNASFFSMYETPFLFGGPWQAKDDTDAVPLIVISKIINDRLFGGANSVGRTIRIGMEVFEITGVIDTWQLTRRFYDRTYFRSEPHEYFVPYTTALNADLTRFVYFRCWQRDQNMGQRFSTEARDRLLNSECSWPSLWAEIPDEQVDDYQQRLTDYVAEQQSYGRFPRGNVTHLSNLEYQIHWLNGLSGYIGNLSMQASLFFAVCILNAVAILLAKYMRRTKEVSLRRALGAKKRTIVSQHIMEVAMIGLMGGVLGSIIAYLFLQGMIKVAMFASDYTARVEDVAPLYALDISILLQTFAIGISCTLITSIYPIWRLCNTPPASQLKAE